MSNQEFGDWMQARKTPFVYFNTSCSSRTKAVNEISAALTPQFLDIPADSTVDMFVNNPSSAEYILFTSFREGRSFAQIRAEMEKGSGEYKERTSNVFLFPDEDQYQREITNFIKIPVILKPFQIFDSKNRIVTIEAHR